MNKRFSKLFSLLVLLSLCLSLSGCASNSASAPEELNVREIKKICQLATLKCKFHSTTRVEKKNSKLVSYIAGKTYKIWQEYEADVTLGIDADKLEIKQNGTTISVTVPEAKVLSTHIDTDDYPPVFDESIFTKKKVRSEAITEVKEKAKEEMEEAGNDPKLLQQARERAKDLIKNYIEQIGKVTGVNYTVEFTD